jgi:hypothetical protein
MSKMIVVVHKPAVELQLQAMLADLNPQELVVLVKVDGGRIDGQTVRGWQCLHDRSGRTEVREVNFDRIGSAGVRRLLSEFKPFHCVAIPFFMGNVFRSNVGWIKKYAKVINISDGSADNLSEIFCFLRLKFRVSRPLDWLKLLVLVFGATKRARADVCYHPFFPVYTNCYAEATRACGKLNVAMEKRDFINTLTKDLKEVTLVLGGNEWPAQVLVDKFQIGSWVSTAKDKVIFLNGVRIELPFFLCAEEFLSIVKPTAVVGYAGDAVAYAKFIYPDVPCRAVPSRVADALWGSYHNAVFWIQNRRLGLERIGS